MNVQQNYFSSEFFLSIPRPLITPPQTPLMVRTTFPLILHGLVNTEDDSIISWSDEGTAVTIHDMDAFVKVMPKYFKHDKFKSFQKQLGLYDFRTELLPEGGFKFSHGKFRQGVEEEICRRPITTTTSVSSFGPLCTMCLKGFDLNLVDTMYPMTFDCNHIVCNICVDTCTKIRDSNQSCIKCNAPSQKARKILLE